MLISISELEKIVTTALLTQYTLDEADLIKEVVLYGELSGRKSHGMLRLLRENYGVFVPDRKGPPEYIQKTKVSALIDGKGNPGMLVGPLAMKKVILLAKANGVGIVGTKGSINSTGALSYYCEQIAKQDLIAVVFAHATPMIAPFTSKKALFGTNPMAFGIPSAPNPIIFDMSTSAITFGAIAKYKADGKQLPENVAIDAEGRPTTDPAQALEGATLAFDNSYKGSGLAMMVEILAGLWAGSSFAGNNAEGGWGNMYMAFSPELLSDVETFKEHTKQLIETLKAAETRDGSRIRIPGESTLTLRDESLRRGEIDVDEALIEKIKNISG